jgi:hypothetical protein
MNIIAISPNYTTDKLVSGDLKDMIDVFEDQMQGWLFDQANQLKSLQHAGFGILAIVLSYFEPIGQFLEGKSGKSDTQFLSGLAAVFPNVDPAIPAPVYGELYNQLRCGMFHRGITKSKVIITRSGQNPIEVVYSKPDGAVQRITVVPVLLLEESERHLKRYVTELRDPKNVQLRQNFEAWFKVRAA